MRNEIFHFKQFDVRDSGAGMPVNTDSVLLGTWAFDNCAPRRILDVGCGSGLISLILAQRFVDAHITGVEIDGGAADLAAVNFSASPWPDRLDVINNDFLSLDMHHAPFDAVICNPPYFENGLTTARQSRAIARHNISLPVDSLFLKVSSILNSNALFALVMPENMLDRLIWLGTKYHLDPQRITHIVTTSSKPSERVLIQFVKGFTTSYSEDILYIRDNEGRFTPQFKSLTEDFYL